MRPFIFSVIIWGERYRDYFIKYCLPSLELDKLERPFRFIIATTEEDQPALIEALNGVELMFYTIQAPATEQRCEYMSRCQAEIAKICLAEKAYSISLTPDLAFSKGLTKHLHEYVEKGAELIVCPAMRFEEERLLPYLTEPLEPRALVKAALASMHSESFCYGWEQPVLVAISPITWWSAPDGIVVHSMSWAPLLMDYGAIPQHNSFALNNWTMDGCYLYDNFAKAKIYAIVDSDEGFIVSWTPAATNPYDATPQICFQVPFVGEIMKAAIFRAGFFGRHWQLGIPMFDPLRQALFRHPICWHFEDLSPAWEPVKALAKDKLWAILKEIPSGQQGIPEQQSGEYQTQSQEQMAGAG